MFLLTKSRTFVALMSATLLYAGDVTRLLLHQPRIISNMAADRTFMLEKYCIKEEYDIIVLGNSRSYMNIDYTIVESYLHDTCSILNFGFGGRSFASLQHLRYAKSLLKKRGKRIFCIFLSNQMHETHGFGLFYQEHLRFYRFFPKKFFSYYLFLSEASLLKKRCFPDNQSHFIFHKKQFWVECDKQPIEESFATNLKLHMGSHGLRMVMNFCKKNNIKCIALHAPTASVFFKLEEVAFQKLGVNEFLTQNGCLLLHVPEKDLQFETYDKVHLSLESGRRFSHWLGRELAKLDWFKENQQTFETEKQYFSAIGVKDASSTPSGHLDVPK